MLENSDAVTCPTSRLPHSCLADSWVSWADALLLQAAQVPMHDRGRTVWEARTLHACQHPVTPRRSPICSSAQFMCQTPTGAYGRCAVSLPWQVCPCSASCADPASPCTGGQTQEEAFRDALTTWQHGVRPIVHWSESQEGRKPHAHSDYIKVCALGPLLLAARSAGWRQGSIGAFELRSRCGTPLDQRTLSNTGAALYLGAVWGALTPLALSKEC